jgi:hypothetical protein
MRNRSTAKKIFYSLAGVVIIIVAAIWIFYAYYFEDVVGNYLTPKLQAAIETATHGHYKLNIGKIVYHNGSLFCTNFELKRVRYGSKETGITLERLEQDTVYLKGLHLISLLRGRGAYMSRMEMDAPRIFVTEVSEGREKIKGIAPDTTPIPKSLPDNLPVISFDSIILSNIQIYMPEEFRLSGGDSIYRGASARLAHFRLDSIAIATEPLLYSQNIDFMLPKVRYDIGDSLYFAEAGPIHAKLSDSLLEIDSFSFRPKCSEDQYSAKCKYLRGMMDFRCADITVEGFNLENLMIGKSLSVHKCSIATWNMNYYSDKRKPRDPHPPQAMMPNDFVQGFHFPVSIDSLILLEGKIKISERAPLSSQPGVITFDHAQLKASPYCTDSSSENCGMPTHIAISAIFLDEAPVTAHIDYELQHTELDMDVEAEVGKLSAKKFNDFLIPNERKEITSGTIEGGNLRMIIHNSVATTTVTPRYKDLAMKVLPKQPGEKGGIIEGIKSFIANTFVLRASNLDKDDIRAVSATTMLRRLPHEEFLQFIWFALRKSLGKVIGGFE